MNLPKIDGIKIVKLAAGNLATYGSSVIVRGLISGVVEPKNKFEKVAITAGSFAIVGVVSELVQRQVDSTIDEIVAIFKKSEEAVETPPSE